MKVKLADIRNTHCQREHGNIDSLKASIADVGLICPLTINQDFDLLAGRRRYQAISELGWQEVECHIVNTNMDNVIIYDPEKIENKCEICGYPLADKHHILPKKYGGTDTTSNYVYLCTNHHRAIHFLIQLDLAVEQNKASLLPKNQKEIQAYLILNDQLIYRFYKNFLRGKLIDETHRATNP